MPRTINFFDGFSTDTVPVIGSIDASSLKQYPDDSSYESENGVGQAGSIYYNTTLDTIRYYHFVLGSFVNAETTSNKGIANGYAGLDGTGKVPAAQLPSYVDDVEEYADLASFPVTGETGKIYIALDTNIIYRWSGSIYIEISPAVGSANTTLSNLDSPTSVNQDLTMQPTKTVIVKNNVAYRSRDFADVLSVDLLKLDATDSIQLGQSTGFNIKVATANLFPANAGASLGAGIQAWANLYVDNIQTSLTWPSNNATLKTINAASTNDFNIETGNASGGNSGKVRLASGTATGTRGVIELAGSHVDVNASSVRPTVNQTGTLGTSSQKFRDLFIRDIFTYTSGDADSTWIRGTTTTTPSGVSVNGAIQRSTNSTTPLALYTPNNGNGSNDILIETGNVSAGAQSSGKISIKTGDVQTGTSKNIELITGSIAGGTRGYILMNALALVLPTGTSDPSTSLPDGASYYNTSTDQIRVLRGGTWRGIVLV